MKKHFTIAIIAVSISACTSTLKDINSGLSTVNSTLNGQSTSQSNNYATPTQAQQQKIQSSLAYKVQDNDINNAVTEASPIISEFIGMNSCITGYNGSMLNRYAAPGKLFPNNNYTGAPAPQMRYHNKAACVSLLRIQGWEMPTKNALRFEVSYISDASGEVVKANNEVVKQPSGEWLFTR